jgi:redox-sensitive bicupin YhaK (pirin superfamily)
MKESSRLVERIVEPEAVVEGAGVKLRRSIGTRSLNYLDPFLLLDHFASTEPDDYRAGFPLHPHRGIETVTYLLRGVVKHRDTAGNTGAIGAGDVQWMTAAGGIMHEEMPQVRPEGIEGFQLWVNLPAKLKMTAPRYQGFDAAQLPEAETKGGTRVRAIAGTIEGIRGPVSGIAADPVCLDVSIPPQTMFVHELPVHHNAFAYVFRGNAAFGSGSKQETVRQLGLAILGPGNQVRVETSGDPVRFLLVAAAPLNEPIARYGPFVMNTREEIEQALADLRNGTFVAQNRVD